MTKRLSDSLSQGSYLAPSPDEAADFEAQKLEFVRAHVGKEIKVMLDGHMGNNPVRTWDLATALAVVKAVEPYNLFFFEEPLHALGMLGRAAIFQHAADVIGARMYGERAPKPFRYRHLGTMATVGRRSAVADFVKFRLSGFIACCFGASFTSIFWSASATGLP